MALQQDGGNPMTETIGIYKKGNDVLRIIRDTDPCDPRTEFDNVGHMACWHGRYNLGDKDHDISLHPSEYSDEQAFMEAVRKEYPNIAVLLPLYLYDHSGIAISVGSSRFQSIDGMGWDWGWIGVIYATKDDIREQFPVVISRNPPKYKPRQFVSNVAIKDAEKVLRSEVEVYDDYLAGRIYGYQRAILELEPEDLEPHGATSLNDFTVSKLTELFHEHASGMDSFDACYGYYGNASIKDILDEHGFSEGDEV